MHSFPCYRQYTAGYVPIMGQEKEMLQNKKINEKH